MSIASSIGSVISSDVPLGMKLFSLIFNVDIALLKVQSCKLCNYKYKIATTQITYAEIFAFIAVLVFKLLGCKVLFISREDNRNW